MVHTLDALITKMESEAVRLTLDLNSDKLNSAVQLPNFRLVMARSCMQDVYITLMYSLNFLIIYLIDYTMGFIMDYTIITS